MLEEEAELIFGMCKELRGGRILNVCSSDEMFYKFQQPWIWRCLLAPLGRENELDNLDMKDGLGVDIVADCCRMEAVADGSYDLVLFDSGLEHIVAPEKAVAEIRRVLRDDGFAVFSAPGVYPRHEDPIDTMLRFPDEGSWKSFLGDAWEIIDYAKTTPMPAKAFYGFPDPVYVTIVKMKKAMRGK